MEKQIAHCPGIFIMVYLKKDNGLLGNRKMQVAGARGMF
jgi:hypothetical protein